MVNEYKDAIQVQSNQSKRSEEKSHDDGAMSFNGGGDTSTSTLASSGRPPRIVSRLVESGGRTVNAGDPASRSANASPLIRTSVCVSAW